MNVFAFILARGGSKGVPKKNIKSLGGKPLITWTIEAAQKAPEVTDIFVSTDSDEIADVARKAGAEVLMRPDDEEMSGDMALAHPVFEYHLTKLAEEGRVPDVVVDLRPTSPLRSHKRISEGIQLLLEKGKDAADSVRAVTGVTTHPLKTWKKEGDYITPFIPEDVYNIKEPFDACRQMLPEAFQNNGAMYAIWPETIFDKKSLTGDKIIGYEMEGWESINIDSEIDFLIASELLKDHEGDLA